MVVQRVRFLICGAQKAGTTALADMLRTHPEIYLPDRKEIHYFDNEDLDWKKDNHELYHQEFREANGRLLWGEATPVYMYWNESARRIYEYNSQMKIVVSLRSPATRAYSQWSMETSRGNETFSFQEAIMTEHRRYNQDEQHRIYSYLQRGLYSYQLERLWSYFGRDQTLVVRYEDLRNDTRETMRRIFDFLEIDPIDVIEGYRSHEGKYSQPMSKEAADFMMEYFEDEISRLEDMLGWDCSEWRR